MMLCETFSKESRYIKGTMIIEGQIFEFAKSDNGIGEALFYFKFSFIVK